jgi:hypothetical protein
MAKRRSETVGSYVAHGEVYTCDVKKGGGDRSRWICSCGGRGPWLDRALKSHHVALWEEHIAKDHPDVGSEPDQDQESVL